MDGASTVSGATLSGRVVPRTSVDEPLRREMLALMHRCYEGVTQGRFTSDLDHKDWVVLVSEKRTGRLAGFTTLRLAEERLDGRPVDLVYSGDTVVHPDWWGTKALQVSFVSFILSRRLARPSRRCMWLLLSGGYKTYLMMVNHLRHAFPSLRYQPSDGEREFCDRVARCWFGDQYDPARGVVRFSEPHYHVRQNVVPIDSATAAHPDVAFYLARNPGHVTGDELVCLAEFRATDLLRSIARMTTKQLTSPARRPAEPAQVAAPT